MAADKGRKVMTPVFRVSFPQVFQPKAFDGGEAKFSISMVWDDTAVKTPQFKALEQIIAEAKTAKWGAKIPANLRATFRAASEKEHLEGYKGMALFANASSKYQPGLVDADLQEIIDPKEFYPGCYARATVTAFAYDNKGNRGVAFGLHNIQKVRDGEPLGSRVNAAEDFAAQADAAAFLAGG